MKTRHGQRGAGLGSCSSLIGCLTSCQGTVGPGKVQSFGGPGQSLIIYGEIVIQVGRGESGPRKAPTIWLHSASNVDPGEFIILSIR